MITRNIDPNAYKKALMTTPIKLLLNSLWIIAFLLILILKLELQSAHAYTVVNPTGLQQAASIDLVGKAGSGVDGATDRFLPREAEALFFSPIDYIFDGMLNLAAHQEAGVATFEIHEAYLGSTRLIPRTRFRVGQYFLAIGRLNQFHRHDWPFISAPKVQRDFFHEEGILDSGAEFNWIAPLPFYLELTAGICNGWTFGHSHNVGQAPLVPTHYLRGATYTSLPWDGGVQTGLNYLARRETDGTQWTYWGLDLTAKWRESQILRGLLQSEAWLRIQTPSGNPSEATLGAYVFPQYGFDPSWYFGIRGDYWTVLTLKNALNRRVFNVDYSIVPTLTFKVSEFTSLKAAYTFQKSIQGNQNLGSSRTFQIQTVFNLGAHPAHDF